MNFLARKKPQPRTFKVFLTRGKYLGVYTWHYVKVDMLKLPLFHKALQSSMIEAANYGEVLFSGWGMNPPDEIRRKIDQKYAA